MKKILLTSILSVVMCISLIAGATFALFTSESEVNIAVTSGKIDVKAVAEIDSANTSFGLAQSSATVNGSNVIIDKIMPMDYVTVNVNVKNNSNVSAKYRAIIESLDSNALANELAIEIDGKDFTGMAYTKWLDLAPETDGQTIVIKIELPKEAEDGQGETCNYSVYVEAVQANAGVTDFNDRVSNGEYTIYDKVDLYQFANSVNSGETSVNNSANFVGKTIKLMEDIDLGNTPWTPIGQIGSDGSSTNFNRSFGGTFDGNNKTVSNYKVMSYGWAGLFGVVYKGDIKNLTVENVEFTANRMAGGVVGQLYGSLENVHANNVTGTVVPNEISDGVYDNGDKVGGIVGWIGDNGNNRTINNCSVNDVTLTAYRDVGGIAGYAAKSTTGSGNSATDVTITADQSVNYYGDKDFNAGGIVGRKAGADVNVQGTETNVNIKTVRATTVTDATDFSSAITNSDSSSVVLNVTEAGTYNLPVTQGKEITIVGNEDVEINVLNKGSQNTMGSTLIFDGVTVVGETSNYYGFFHTESIMFKNCKLEKLQFLYAQNVVFENCTFVTDSTEHCIWTYGAKNISFKDCDFTYSDRCINVYLDKGTGSVEVAFENCTFSTSNTASKGAVEINSSAFPQGAKVSFTNCTAPAYGTMVGISGWDGTNGATATVTVDGVTITPTQWAQ